MDIQLDHVTIAGSDLGVLQRAFAGAGLLTDYGGVHSNGVTHMALLGFDDGSYIELISTVEPGTRSPWWPAHIIENGGPCGWCARVHDLAAECARLASLDIPVRGPVPYHRDRPDGGRIEWDLAFVGSGEPGSTLPFLIQDRTPREQRVQSSASARGSELSGVAKVVIGVRDLAWNAELFRHVYGWIARETRPDPAFGAMVVEFAGTPVALAAPLSDGSWLSGRLAEFGDSPAALLLRSTDLDRSASRLPTAAGTWLNHRALWFNPDRLGGTRLGIIQ
ncbi:MAG: VOC family protein [Gemmatimonadetes bacterium]|nr:VOC family protein [Gemmatimonadota bacterium]